MLISLRADVYRGLCQIVMRTVLDQMAVLYISLFVPHTCGLLKAAEHTNAFTEY